MKKFTNILILSIFTILMIGGFAKSAFAVDPNIVFENTPLFGANGTGELNFSPGSSVTRFIKITNNTDVDHRAIVRALESVNTDKLGDAINLTIKQDDIILYDDTFSNFFNKSEVILPQVKAGKTNTINFTASFKKEADNDYQNKTMNFSLQAGLEDVAESTDTTTTIGGGSSGSYITLGQKNLIISNENATAIGVQGTIMVSWNTNIPATSQVIYGLTSGGPYNLDLTAPNFGYPFSTIETDLDPNKITDHIINITSLPLGEYSYRVVSRASPATVSYEHRFTVPLLAQGDNNNNTILNNNPNNNILNTNGQVLGAENGQSAIVEPTTDQNVEDLNNNEGNLLGASAGNIMGIPSVWFWFAVILLLILIIFLIIYRRRKNK